jgi:uncharacterized alpha-E superfamily protein
MLARNAEALYWIGRYVERADDTARILDVTVHQLLEDSSVDPDHTSRVLLQVLGIEAPDTERFATTPRAAAPSSTPSRPRGRTRGLRAR